MPLSSEDRRILKRVAANDPSLREVDFGGKGIGDDGAKKVAEALRGNAAVTVLYLWNNGIGAEGAMDLAKALLHNSAVTELYLAYNDIGDEGAKELAKVLLRNSTITKLRLRGNGIGAEGAKELAKALLRNSTITCLDLRGNGIGAEGAKEVAKALLRNSSVTWLRLRNNGIGDEGAKELAKALLHNSTVTWLGLSDNDISAELFEEVEELVRINERASNPQEALRLKVERLVASNDGGGAEAAVSLTLERLDTFPSAGQRRELFGRLLGSERGKDVAAAADVATGRTLYWLAAECGAAPGALMSVLRAHPSLVTCRDVNNRLYPFALLATMPTADVGDVFELLLLNPALVEGGISQPIPGARATRK